MNKNELRGCLMAALFISGEALEVAALAQALEIDADDLDVLAEEWIREAENREDGILLKRIGDKLQLCTNPKYGPFLKELFVPPDRTSLSNSVMETLSIVAYKQPVTRAEIDEIRGVRSNYAITTLKEKGLVHVVGYKEALGRPALLGTTDEFLRHFGISSLEELPKIDFEAMEGQPVGEEDMDTGHMEEDSL